MGRTHAVCRALLIALLWIPAAALAQNRSDQQMLLDLRVVQEQTQQLRLSINQLIEQLKAVNVRLDTEANARNKGFADQQTLINNIIGSLATLQENVRDNKVQVQKLNQEIDAIKKGVDMLTTLTTQALAQMPASTLAGPGAPAGSAPTAAAPMSGGVPPSANDYLTPAREDYFAGRYDLAIAGFEQFLKRFPTSPDAPSAQYTIGDSYFLLGRFKEAVDAYGLVIKNYRLSAPDVVADAYFKQGSAYENLKQRDLAIANYQLLRKDFAGTNGELQATQALRRLGIIR
jgi:TolA-binding protein